MSTTPVSLIRGFGRFVKVIGTALSPSKKGIEEVIISVISLCSYNNWFSYKHDAYIKFGRTRVLVDNVNPST